MAPTEVRGMALPAFVRRAHRVIATLWLVFFALTLGTQAVGVQSLLVTGPLIALLLVLILTGGYLLVRPWLRRYRSG